MTTFLQKIVTWWTTPTLPAASTRTPMVVDRVKLSPESTERWSRESYPRQRLQTRFR